MEDRDARAQQLKRELAHTWDAFFTRFGRFTEIQLLASERLLAGANCLLVAPTASGKTEGALAPLLELQQRRGSEAGLSIIYLTPTRALARDLARRLAPPLEKLSLPLRIKTGDDPALDPLHPPRLLITTPESLDSLLANRPRMVKDVRAIVIDELHIFDNTVRGDQLRILLNRLRRIRRYALSRGDTTSERVQYCALSATIAKAVEAAGRYFPNPEVVGIGGQRAIEAEVIDLGGADDLIHYFKSLRARGVKKALAFCESRAECEQWAHRLRSGTPFGESVYLHHAGLAASMRRVVESHFARAEAGLCFATSTLELGIDIGDVDLIILIGPPGDERAFLQRIGRGNRRKSRTSVLCCARDNLEQALFEIFIRTAEQGLDEASVEPYFFRPSVIVQQLCSYIKQTRSGEIDVESSYQLFSETSGEPLISRQRYLQIIEHLIARQYFLGAPRGTLRPGPAWQELYERRAIYTNLLDSGRNLLEVIAAETGRKIGEIERGALPGKQFLFGGRGQRATRLIGRKLMVEETEAKISPPSPRWFASRRPLSSRLARKVAAELDLPRAVDRSALAVVDESENEANEAARSRIFHGSGRPAGLILGDILRSLYRVRVVEVDDLCVVVTGRLAAGALEFTGAQVRAVLRRRWQQMESWYGLGRFQDQLPLDVRRESVIAAFDLASFLTAFQGRRLAAAGEDGE